MATRCLIVGLGGFVGAIARYLIGGWVQQRWGAFPYGTLIVNLSGAFLLGLLTTLALRLAWSEESRLLIGVGVLGAYTTFSTLEVESLHLITEGRRFDAAANLLGSVAAGLVAAWLGVLVARLLVRGPG